MCVTRKWPSPTAKSNGQVQRIVELRKEVTAMRFIFWYAVAAQAATASEESELRKEA